VARCACRRGCVRSHSAAASAKECIGEDSSPDGPLGDLRRGHIIGAKRYGAGATHCDPPPPRLEQFLRGTRRHFAQLVLAWWVIRVFPPLNRLEPRRRSGCWKEPRMLGACGGTPFAIFLLDTTRTHPQAGSSSRRVARLRGVGRWPVVQREFFFFFFFVLFFFGGGFAVRSHCTISAPGRLGSGMGGFRDVVGRSYRFVAEGCRSACRRSSCEAQGRLRPDSAFGRRFATRATRCAARRAVRGARGRTGTPGMLTV